MRTTPLASWSRLFEPSDEQAMWRVQTTADAEAFALLVRRWEEPIRRLCTRMCGDEHLGDDLAQEAFTRVFVKRGEYRAGSRFSTWLWRIALNLSYDELRRRRRRPEVALGDADAVDLETATDVAESPDAAPGPDVAAVQSERAGLVRHALQTLPEHYRSVLVLRHYEGLKFREIAEVLDVPEGTVKSRMAEALTRLADHLAPMLGPVTTEPAPPSPTLLFHP